MRPYHIAGPRERSPGGGYIVPAHPAPLQRPNRLAAGMAATLRRQVRGVEKPSETALMLSVRGTLDPLSAMRFDLVRKPCPCCGHPTAVRLALKPGAAKSRRLAMRRRYPVRPLP